VEIQDIGLPNWTLQLPHGMVLKMSSAQGVLLIPDDDEQPEDPDTLGAYRSEIKRLQGLLDFANATIEDMKEELYEKHAPDGGNAPELPFPTREQVNTAIGNARKTLGEMQAEEIEAAKQMLAVGLDDDGEYKPTDLRDDPGIIDADDLPPGHYDC